MRTPAGQECRYFYGDYFRGRNHEECRLFEAAKNSHQWTSSLCAACPVPEILRANTCEHMILHPTVYRPFLVGKPRVRISAYCTKSQVIVQEPHVGCGSCHPLPFRLPE